LSGGSCADVQHHPTVSSLVSDGVEAPGFCVPTDCNLHYPFFFMCA
jgi:hypothetical protein